MGKFIDLTGQKFGKLTAIEVVKNHNRKGNESHWKCLCDCGNYTVVRSSELRHLGTKSCGCSSKELEHQTRYGKLPVGQLSSNFAFERYRDRALRDGLEFNLSLEEFTNITSKDCVYCGNPPSKKIERKNEVHYYNGVDRVDNKKGYILGNCVPCCAICNYMKRDHNVEFFKEHIKKIYNYLY